jgi:hypothetical protein
MEADLEKRARKLVDILESTGSNCGLLVRRGTVVIRRPGASSDSPTPYEEADLNNAIELNLLKKQPMMTTRVPGSYEWEWYVVRERTAK